MALGGVALVLPVRPAAADLADIIRKLDRTEWEIVQSEVFDRLPSLFMSNDERAMFDTYMSTSQSLASVAEMIESHEYQGLGALSAKFLSENLGAAISERFGEDSLVHKVVVLVEDQPTLAKELVLAALNADAHTAAVALKEALRKYASTKAEELRNQGENFWKDMIRSVVPRGGALAEYGFDPVDVYFQGISRWADFTARARVRFNNTALNCLAVRYRVLIERGEEPAWARELVEDTGMGSGMGREVYCVAELERRGGGASEKGFFRSVWDSVISQSGQSTAAEGELDLNRTQIVDLIEIFESERPGRDPGEFADWLERRLLTNVQRRANGLTDALVRSVEREAQEQQSLAQRFLALVAAAVDDLPTSLAASPAAGEEVEEDPSTEPVPTDRDDAPVAGGPIVPPVQSACDALGATVNEALRHRAASDLAGLKALAPRLNESIAAAQAEGCDPALVRSALEMNKTTSRLADLQNRARLAVSSCEPGHMAALLQDIPGGPSSLLHGEWIDLQTASSGVDAFERALADYQNNALAEAEAGLRRSLDAFSELPGGACSAYIVRAERGLQQIATIRADEHRVAQAVASCNLASLTALRAEFAGRTHIFFVRALGRIDEAGASCRSENAVIEAGRACQTARAHADRLSADYVAGRLDSAQAGLRQLLGTLGSEHDAYCGDVRSRVNRGLSLIDQLRANEAALGAALRSCATARLEELSAEYLRHDHVWFRQAAARIDAGLRSCSATASRTTPDMADPCAVLTEMEGRVAHRYGAGDLSATLSLLREARAYADHSSLPAACEGRPGAISASLDRVSALVGLIERANLGAQTCDPDLMEAANADLSGQSNAAASQAKARLAAAFDDCFGDGDAAGAEVTTVPDGATGDVAALDGDWRGGLQLTHVFNEKEISWEVPFDLRLNAGTISGSIQVSPTDANVRLPLRGRMAADRIELAGEITDNGATNRIELSGTFVDGATLAGEGRLSMADPACMFEDFWDKSNPDETCPIIWIHGTWRADH